VLKVVPAIISGSSVVLKPSEVAPQTAFAVAEALEGAGLPAGVLNIVNGPGASVGAALAEHEGIDIVSFTGSVPTGRKVAAAAARHGARSALELGGKSASIVLQAEQLEAAVRFTVANCMSNSGQTCAALSRLLVPREQLGETVDLLREIIDALIVGDPYDASTHVGPLASRKQQTAVLGMIREASEQGSELVAGGNVDDLPSTGWFVPPTAFVASPESPIAQTEVFGPVITILSYESVAEAIAIANATRFGLIARAWTDNQQQFEDVAHLLQAGSVMKNDVRTVWAAPFGGVKDSGYGRERGAYGIEEYLVTKSLQF
jgi:acyl-CoA reductase-like NAD-dependent aldehyde dehydrogenase